MMIDTHSHIQVGEFDHDRDTMIERSRNADVRILVAVGTDIATSRAAIALAEKEEGIYATVGVHPNTLMEAPPDWPEQVRAMASHAKVKAIGETGLDFYRHQTAPELQREALTKHLEIARDLRLPIVLHSRAAGKEVLDVVEESAHGEPTRGVMHCFTEQEPVMLRAVKLGLHISFAGPVTYPISRKNREVLKRVPDDRILVETDSPYLGAEPVKHRRNEPAYLRYVLTKVAEMRRISPRDASRITTLNADDLFGLGVGDRAPKVAYGIRSALYLNLTNRCTASCAFCPRVCGVLAGSGPAAAYIVKGHNLRLEREPDAKEVIEAMGEISPYREVVFCGLGEPTIRLDVLLQVAKHVRGQGQRVRLDTNGHGSLYHGRSIVPDLGEVLDAISISLNAADAESYVELCRPEQGEKAYEALLQFIRECRDAIPEVTVTSVEGDGVRVADIKKLANSLGVKYHGRRLDEVG
jgi:TatD DNase family protein